VTTTVLIVDDNRAFRALARMVLEAGGIEVVGEAGDAASGLDAARRLHPQVVLLDVRLPDADGLSIAAQFGDDETRPAVVAISTQDPRSLERRIGQSAVRGFIPKAELSVPRLLAVVGAAP